MSQLYLMRRILYRYILQLAHLKSQIYDAC